MEYKNLASIYIHLYLYPIVLLQINNPIVFSSFVSYRRSKSTVTNLVSLRFFFHCKWLNFRIHFWRTLNLAFVHWKVNLVVSRNEGWAGELWLWWYSGNRRRFLEWQSLYPDFKGGHKNPHTWLNYLERWHSSKMTLYPCQLLWFDILPVR